MSMPKTVIYRQHGNPQEVLEVINDKLEAPGPQEALVTRIVSPVNPADLNAIEGKYPIRPALPGVPGVEGAGIVESVGAEVAGLEPGTVVLLPHGFGTWRDAGLIHAENLTPVPSSVPFLEAAMIKINPATAWRMLHDFVPPLPGSWVIQNASNSAVGRHVIAIARELGLRTVNLVRRPELIEELKAEGADCVLMDDDSTKETVKAATGGAPIHLALNAVGGESATRLANALASGGVVVTYGAMSRQPVKIPTGLLIFKDIAFRGFLVSRWYQSASAEDRQAMFRQLFEFAARGVIRTPVERIYRVEEVQEAVIHAGKGARGGKILLGAEPTPEKGR